MKTRMILLCLFFWITGCANRRAETADLNAAGAPIDASVVKTAIQNTPRQEALKDLYSNGKAN